MLILVNMERMKKNSMFKLFIQKTLYVISYVISLFFYFTKIDNRKIFLFSFNGDKYACNQRYLTEYILKQKPFFTIVWVYKNENTKKEIPDLCIKVKKYSISYFYHYYTSRFISTNMRILCYDLLNKRPNQFYIQTWHSSARQKKIEKDAEKKLSTLYINDAKRDSKMINLMISGCDFSTEIFTNSFYYDGDILKIGTMRNDILFKISSDQKKRIKNKYEINEQYNLLLYAPTFRNKKDYNYSLNYERLVKSLEKKFGGKWIIAIKQHPNVKKRLNKIEHVIDLTYSEDIQELFLVSDILITDYSSVIFDFMLLKRPFFIFTPDLYTYDRDLYFSYQDLPTPLCHNMEELENAINSFCLESFQQDLKNFDKNFLRSYEKGNACQQMYEYLIERVNNYETI
ncbi:CDP-glycerol glycerophosphotransferase family protein [[Clostridium] innocuum]|nr:CDP-glycerol glycerophosphotransferase family protein [[Clostridium] innocuum]